jgi:D-amino-acid dehydrogenase
MGAALGFIGIGSRRPLACEPSETTNKRMQQQVVVIGGGIVGLTTAWALLEAGHRVTLVERAAELASGASHANGGQLSYRYVSPLADEGVPLKAMKWLLDPHGPLRFRLEADPHQWRWMSCFLAKCRASVNRVTTQRLLALGAFSQQTFGGWESAGLLDDVQLRAPGKLVLYRQAAEFGRVRAKLPQQGPERALDATDCIALEPALAQNTLPLAGGIFTEGEAVADCHRVCVRLGEKLRTHPNFQGFVHDEALGFEVTMGRAQALRLRGGSVAGDAFVIAAGLHSRALAQTLNLRLPLYPLKGYSLTAPIGAEHRAPEVSVTDFEKKILYARIGSDLRVAAMVDLVGDDDRIDPNRIASLQRAVEATFPRAADHSQSRTWAGLRPATPSGAPIVGRSGTPGVWLNVGHGALGFTFSFATAAITAALISGRESPLPLDGLTL